MDFRARRGTSSVLLQRLRGPSRRTLPTYRIASAIFMLVYRDRCQVKIQPDNARHLSQWLTFVLGPTGQRLAASTPGFAPLLAEIAARAKATARRLACDGKRL